MAETSTVGVKAPWHLWVIGAVSLLWNAMGAVDFTMTQLHYEAYLKNCTPEQKDYIFSFPLWAVLAWGVATWGSVLGSLCLLLRRRAAVVLFAVSLVGMILTTLENYVFTDGLKVMGASATGALIFSGVIAVVSVLLLLYARTMRARGVLR